MTPRLEKLMEKIAENQVELQQVQKEMGQSMSKLAEVVAGSVVFMNGLHDRQTKPPEEQ